MRPKSGTRRVFLSLPLCSRSLLSLPLLAARLTPAAAPVARARLFRCASRHALKEPLKERPPPLSYLHMRMAVGTWSSHLHRLQWNGRLSAGGEGGSQPGEGRTEDCNKIQVANNQTCPPDILQRCPRQHKGIIRRWPGLLRFGVRFGRGWGEEKGGVSRGEGGMGGWVAGLKGFVEP
jgi:hypothetical protein